MSRSTGTVTSYNSKNGYGFITDSESKDNVFVHQNDIDMEGFRHLNVGEEVEFDIEQGEKGLKATSVVLLSEREERPRNKPPRRNPGGPKRGHNSSDTDGDITYLKTKVTRLERTIERLLNIMADGEDPLLEEDEIEEIRTGKRVARAG